MDTSDLLETVQAVTAKIKVKGGAIPKRWRHSRSWVKRSVSTLSRSLMLLFFMLILSSCTQEDTIGAGKNITESEYSKETGEMYNHLTTSDFIRDIVNGQVQEFL